MAQPGQVCLVSDVRAAVEERQMTEARRRESRRVVMRDPRESERGLRSAVGKPSPDDDSDDARNQGRAHAVDVTMAIGGGLGEYPHREPDVP